jgi:integrase
MHEAFERFMVISGGGSTTVAELVERIVAQDAASGFRSAGEFKNAVRPFAEVFGSMPIGDIEARHCLGFARFVQSLQHKGGAPLAPSTILSFRWAAARVTGEAVLEGLITVDPFKALPSKVWPSKRTRRDFRPEPFGLLEVGRLYSNPEVPAWRRALWATLGLTGIRQGEGAALRIVDWRRSEGPLTALRVERSYSSRRQDVGPTKTGAVRTIPVHPVLRDLLAGWLDVGWRGLVGRDPRPGDFMFPRVWQGELHPHYQPQLRKWLQADLEVCDLPHPRRVHDMRHGFVHSSKEAGVHMDALRLWTHARNHRSVQETYFATPSWRWQCDELLKLDAPMPWRPGRQMGLL